MARDIDKIIDFVKAQNNLPPVIKQVVINRLDPKPTKEEIDIAANQVYSE